MRRYNPRRTSQLVAIAGLLGMVLSVAPLSGPNAASAAVAGLPSFVSFDVKNVGVTGLGQLSTISRDGNANTMLADGRGFWAFADAGYRDAAGVPQFVSSSGTVSVAGSPAKMSDVTDGRGLLSQLIPASTGSCPSGAAKSFWPRSMVRVGSGAAEFVYVYFERLCNYASASTGVARYQVSAGGAIVATVLNANLFDPGTNQPGSAAATRDGDPYVYTWWASGGIHVGRVLPTSIANSAAYEYWNGVSWTATRSSAADLGFSCCNKPSVSWIPQISRWVMADYAGPFMSATDVNRGRASLRFATQPQGPWSAPVTAPLPGCSGYGSPEPTRTDCRAIEVVPSASSSSGIGLAYHNPRQRSGLQWPGFEDGQTQLTTVRVSPFGVLDAVSLLPGDVARVSGWTIEPEASAATTVQLSIDGVLVGSPVVASISRADANSKFPEYGSGHGFEFTSPTLSPGSHRVCVTATNTGVGVNASLGCRQVWTSTIFHPMDPTRLFDSRSQAADAGRIAANHTSTIPFRGQAGIPASATAVVFNLTATQVGGNGYVSSFASGMARPVASVLNFEPGRDVANLVTVGLDASGSVSFFAGGASTHLLADVVGYYTPSAPSVAGRTVLLRPSRIFDSRTGGTRLPAATARIVPVKGRGGIPATGAASVILNLTVTDVVAANTYVSVLPGNKVVNGAPATSSVNVSDTRANQVTVPLDSSGSVKLWPNATASVMVDVVGYVTDESSGSSSATGLFVPIEPTRLLDTRSGGVPTSGSDRVLSVAGKDGVGAIAAGIVGNVTLVQPLAASYVTGYPNGTSRPLASTVNAAAAGQIRPNQMSTGLGSGAVRLFLFGASGHLLFDASGWITA